MAAKVLNFVAGAARIKRGHHQSSQSRKSRTGQFVASTRHAVNASQAHSDSARLVDMLNSMSRLRVAGMLDAMGQISWPTGSVQSPAFGNLAQELSDIRRRLARIEAAVCPKEDRSASDRDRMIAESLGANPRVDAVFVGYSSDTDVDAYIIVREHHEEVYEHATNAECDINEALMPSGATISVHVWAHQGRGPLASPPPNARAVFVRG